jgi:diadenylate cyclase
MPQRRGTSMTAALALVAPGTGLRDGLDRVVKAKRGALVVVGDGADVLEICSGGFLMDAEFTPQRLAELCKMDSAIILTPDAGRIARANVHLVPDPSVPTSETGTRHRTAERVARSLAVPVISVSEDMGVINVYVGADKHTLEEIPRLLVRGNQGLQTLERYKVRLDDAATSLTALEVEDLVTLRDVAAMLQRSETVRRVAEQIQASVVELGVEAHLLRLQMDELLEDVDDDRELVLLDYLADSTEDRLAAALAALAALSTDDLLDLRAVAATLCTRLGSTLVELDGEAHAGNGRGPSLDEESLEGIDLDQSLQPRGYRLLSKVPRLPEEAVDPLVARFGSLQKLMRASTDELASVDGVERTMAHAAKEGLARLAESTLLDRFH